MKTPLLAVVVSLFFAWSTANAGLLAHYAFDDNFDDSASANTATTNGSVSFSTGEFGSAADFNTGEYLTLQDVDVLQDFSVSLWVRFDSNSSSAGTVFAMGPQTSSPHMRMRIRSTGALDVLTSQSGFSTGGVNINDGDFHHAVLVADGDGSSTDVSFFVDGILVGQDTHVGFDMSGTQSTFVALHKWGPTSQAARFDGAVDDLAIYDHALSASEISALGSAPAESNFNSIPEAPTTVLLLLGLTGLVRRQIRRRKNAFA